MSPSAAIFCLVTFVATMWMTSTTSLAKAGRVQRDKRIVQLCVKTVRQQPIFYQVMRETYTFRPGDTLTDVLAKHGDTGKTYFELYTEDRWQGRVMTMNPDITNWDKVSSGQRVILEYPERVHFAIKEIKSASDVCVPVGEEHERQKIKDMVDHAAANKIEDIANLPKESLDQVPQQVIVDKLTEEKLQKLPAKTIAKIPPGAVKAKAQEVSFFDSRQPGMNKLFDSISDEMAGGYLGMRYGLSVVKAKNSALASKMRIIGLLAEVRGGALSGLRLSWDEVPEGRAKENGSNVSARWRRVSVGYSFEIPIPHIIDYIHIAPKLGQYTLDATIPIGVNDDGSSKIHRFSIGRGLAAGLEVDAELASIFYVLRGWAAKDFSGIGIKSKEKVSSTRMGLDIYLKGSGFSWFTTPISMTYLAFIFKETVDLSGKEPELGSYVVTIDVPFAGLGFGLQW